METLFIINGLVSRRRSGPLREIGTSLYTVVFGISYKGATYKNSKSLLRQPTRALQQVLKEAFGVLGLEVDAHLRELEERPEVFFILVQGVAEAVGTFCSR